MTQINHGPLLKKLAAAILIMFGFAFALVPLYSVICKVTGLNGKTAQQPASAEHVAVDNKRLIQVEFLAHIDPHMPWQFSQEVDRVQVKPGEVKLITYRAFNPTDHDMVGQAVPSVSPGLAAAYFKKIECFCFQKQPLQAGESKAMALKFYIDPALPAEINTISLSYSLYDITQSTPIQQIVHRR